MSTNDLAIMAAQVRDALEKLRAEYIMTQRSLAHLGKLESELRLLPVPIDDFKAAIIDYVERRGQDFLPTLEAEINRFANPERRPGGPRSGPIGYDELSAWLDGKIDTALLPNYPEHALRLVRPNAHRRMDDCFYALLSGPIMEALTAILPRLEVQYTSVGRAAIGSTRAERQVELERLRSLQSQHATRLIELTKEIKALGGDLPRKSEDADPKMIALGLTDAIGAAPALRCIENFKGRVMTFPSNEEATPELVGLIGRDHVRTLYARYQDHFLPITGDERPYVLELRAKEIAARLSSGATVDGLARHYGMEEREIHKISAAARATTTNQAH